jgi:hypothetical protein
MKADPQPFDGEGARCLLYRDAPSWQGCKTAAIGGFRCESPASGAALLEQAAELLRSEGFEALLGPMEGDTWHSYRLVTESDGSPPFLLEPVGGTHDLAAFAASGFAPVSAYVSTRARLDDAIGAAAPVGRNDATVAAWDGRDAEALIEKLFDMSTASFSDRPFFKKIGKSAFLKLYEPVLPLLDPRLVLFARDRAGGLVGFLFGFADRLEGDQPHTVILKTYASARHGVGHLLADTFHRTARDLGLADVIHALMHVDNLSLDRSRQHSARIFRRYALMGRRLL